MLRRFAVGARHTNKKWRTLAAAAHSSYLDKTMTPPIIPIWLDCDPGHDDAMAIILAGHSQSVRLLGISTVAGNQSLAKVTNNALDVLDAAGLPDIEVVAGQAKPLMRGADVHCAEIHGDSGLDGPAGGRLLPRSRRPALQGRKAVEVMASALQAAALQGDGVVKPRLVCIGALTNAALLLALYPELTQQFELVLMGGAMGVGNTGPVQEFNIQTDPEAAKLVFESGVHLTMIPLEVTHSVLVTPEVQARIGGAASSSQATTPFRAAVQQLLMFFAETYQRVFKFEHPPLHDPCAVAFVIAPELFQTEHMRVDIETASTLSPGQTVCDIWHQSGRKPNAIVATQVNVAVFWQLMLNAIALADQVSPLNQLQRASHGGTDS